MDGQDVGIDIVHTIQHNFMTELPTPRACMRLLMQSVGQDAGGRAQEWALPSLVGGGTEMFIM